MAANQGQAIITDRAGFNINDSTYILIRGLKFTGTATAVNMNNSNHIRVTRNIFSLANSNNPSGIKWVQFSGSQSHHNRIDHNEFGPRVDLGQMIAFQGTVMSQYDVIEYNYFHDAAPQLQNGGETIRVGLSGSSMSNGFATIQYNLFVNLDSDPEIISVKSGKNSVRYNTFINNKGQVTARHGHGNSYNGNFFFRTEEKSGVGGLRIYGSDHKIYNNYFENISGTIHIDGGDYDAGPDGSNYDSSVLTKHWRVYRVQVFNNTIVNSSSGIVIGKSYTYAPVDSIVANNIVVGSNGPLYNEMKTSNTVFEGNISYGGVLGNVPRSSSEIREVNPLLAVVNGLNKLSAASPAIDAAVGNYPVVDDMDGQVRLTNDVGADEYQEGLIRRQPLTVADVGPNAVTEVNAQVDGTSINKGWYSSDVSVKLGALNVEEGGGRVEYLLNSQTVWQAVYSNPIRLLEEGEQSIRYRFVKEGIAEPERLLQIHIDKTTPVYRLIANGQLLTDKAVFSDSTPLNLQLQVEDAISGVAKQSFTVAGATYETQAVIPLAGRLGEQQVVVKVEDVAGNTKEAVHRYQVIPTLETLLSMIEQYVASGDIRGPFDPQLINSLRQAQHHYDKDKGSWNQTVKFLEKVVQIVQKPMQGLYISPSAKQALITYTQALIDYMK
jgi:hypothetical protein